MESMNDLRDLLRHEIQDLYSAEEQIIAAMPAMIERAKNPMLKKALKEHLKVTEKQRTRLEKVQGLLNEGSTDNGGNKGLLNRLFKRNMVCKGMKGILEEGQKIMSEDMSPAVMDAAIIASAQKIEHYEICGYGTAKAFARELNLDQIAELLEETLEEEYQADDMLTDLAVMKLNQQAEKASGGKRSTATAPENGSRGNGNRTSSKEKARTAELEMVSNKGSRSSGRQSTTGRDTDTSGTTRNAAAGRSTASGRGATEGTRATKSGGTPSGSKTRGGSEKGGNTRGSNSGRAL